MDAMMTSLILIMVGLSVILIILVLFYVNAGKATKAISAQAYSDVVDFETIHSVVTQKQTSKERLYEAIEVLIRDYSHITRERPISAYVSIIEALCVHPQTDSRLILRLEKELRMANIEQEEKLDQALKRGLEARG